MIKHCLVTGGFGFLGRRLVQHLLEGGDRAHVVDDLSGSSLDVAETFAQRMHHLYPKSLTNDKTTIKSYFKRDVRGWRYDEIYHLASVVGPVGVLRHAGQIASAIVGDVSRVTDLAARWGSAICDVSTSEVYGGGRAGACSESDDRRISPEATARIEYAAAKIASEVALVNAAKDLGIHAVIIRPFNVAGPGQSAKGGFVVPRFVDQALAGAPITVYGDGSAVRAFTHVADVADGIVKALRSGKSGTAYNLGYAENRTTILALARLVLQVTNSASQIVHVDPKDLHGALFSEAGDKFPDGDLAQRELGWRPSRNLEHVVRDAVEWASADPSRAEI